MTLINHPRKHIGLSTDTKPTEAANSPIPAGSTFYEYDTGILFITYDGTSWVEKMSPADVSNSADIPLFGAPLLYSARNGTANWMKSPPGAIYQKGSTQFAVKMYADNTNDDWASVVVPVDELSVLLLSSSQWTYWMTNAESGGVNIVIWVHDPADFSKRAEISQLMGLVSKDAGFNVETLNATADELFYYGENISGSDLSAGTNYTWAEFQADPVFSTWDIYRITFDYGWLASTTQEDVWLTEVAINGEQIPLKPSGDTYTNTIAIQKTMVASTKQAGDVYSEHGTSGTMWTFPLGGNGDIQQATIMHDAAITERFVLFLFGQPPTGEDADGVANTTPVTADALFFLGAIKFDSLTYIQTGDAWTLASTSTAGGLPIHHENYTVYGTLVGQDGSTTVAEALTIAMTSEMKT